MSGAGASVRIRKQPCVALGTGRLRRGRPPLIYSQDHLPATAKEDSLHESRVPDGRLAPWRHAPAKRMNGQLSCLSSMATRHILTDLAGDYETRHGTRLEIRSMGGVEAAKSVRAGEATDIVILASKVMASLEAESHLAKGETRDFARSEIGLAVRKGSALPNIASEQAVKQCVLDAKKLCYSTGPSGDRLKALCEKWGVPPERVLVAPPGVPVATLIAKGDADLGFQQLSELIGQPGIEVVGPLPSEIQAVTVFSAGISMNSLDPEGARAFVAYLASVDTEDTKRRHGMEPV
jgi:molybdate transport system substrate-binding protein